MACARILGYVKCAASQFATLVPVVAESKFIVGHRAVTVQTELTSAVEVLLGVEFIDRDTAEIGVTSLLRSRRPHQR